MDKKAPYNIRSIPAYLLIHSIEYEEYVGEKSFGSEWRPKETINNVLFQSTTEMTISSDSREYETTGKIFLDAQKTAPFKMLGVGSKIKFKGRDLVVMDCSPKYAFDPDTPHHYEVRVM